MATPRPDGERKAASIVILLRPAALLDLLAMLLVMGCTLTAAAVLLTAAIRVAWRWL